MFSVTTAMGSGKRALEKLKRWIRYNHREIVDAKYFYTFMPNDPENYIVSEHKNIAKKLAKEATPIGLHFSE